MVAYRRLKTKENFKLLGRGCLQEVSSIESYLENFSFLENWPPRRVGCVATGGSTALQKIGSRGLHVATSVGRK